MREFTKEQKIQIWENQFKSASYEKDFFGRYVSKQDFEADHIWPYEKGGKTVVENGQVLSKESNEEKSDKLSGCINGRYFKVIETFPGSKIGKIE